MIISVQLASDDTICRGILNMIMMCYFIFGPHKFLLVPYLYTLQFVVLIPRRLLKTCTTAADELHCMLLDDQTSQPISIIIIIAFIIYIYIYRERGRERERERVIILCTQAACDKASQMISAVPELAHTCCSAPRQIRFYHIIIVSNVL